MNNENVKTPLARALISGFFAFSMSLSIIGGGIILLDYRITWRIVAEIVAVSAALANGFAWWIWSDHLAIVRRHAIITLENLIQVDVDSDGVIGEPQVSTKIGRTKIAINNGRIVYVDFDITHKQAVAIWNRLTENGFVYSRSQMKDILTKRISDEIGRYLKESEFYERGNELNEYGRVLFESLAN